MLPLLLRGCDERPAGPAEARGSVKERVSLCHRPERTGSGQHKESIKHWGKEEDQIRLLGAPQQSGFWYFIKIEKLVIGFQLPPQQVGSEALVPVMI